VYSTRNFACSQKNESLQKAQLSTGADLESIIRCRHWSSCTEGNKDIKFVLEILCMKKQQKFKFVFEKISSDDPFQPIYDSLSEKIATYNRKETGVLASAERSIKVRMTKDYFCCYISFDILIQTSSSYLTPQLKPSSLSDDVSTFDVHTSCVSLISQTLEILSKSGVVFATAPKQSSDSSTELMNHVEALCNVIPLLQDNIRMSAVKMKEIELSDSNIRKQNHELSKMLNISSQQQRTSDVKMQTMMEIKNQHDFMAESVLSCKMQIQELEKIYQKSVCICEQVVGCPLNL
jgi:hypothetical protein